MSDLPGEINQIASQSHNQPCRKIQKSRCHFIYEILQVQSRLINSKFYVKTHRTEKSSVYVPDINSSWTDRPAGSKHDCASEVIFAER